MPTPEFILTLREKIGHDLLWLSGVTAIVLDAGERVLLTRRVDSGEWSLISGILEPGEQPAQAVVREVREETGVDVVVERLVSVMSQQPIVVPNGDRCQFLDITFRCRHASGEAHVADDENAEVRWFEIDEMPELAAGGQHRLEVGLVADGLPYFER